MKYYVLLLIKVINSEQFIQVGLDYTLPFHPNLTDDIEVAGYPCEINRIYYNLDNLDYAIMRVTAVDCLLYMRPHHSPVDVHKWLAQEWQAIKEWTANNNERAILDDYLHHPEKPFCLQIAT